MLTTFASSALMSVRDFTFESCAPAGADTATTTSAASTVCLIFTPLLRCPWVSGAGYVPLRRAHLKCDVVRRTFRSAGVGFLHTEEECLPFRLPGCLALRDVAPSSPWFPVVRSMT